MKPLDTYLVKGGEKVSLNKFSCSDDGDILHEEALHRFNLQQEKLIALQELLSAERRYALLIVLQAMDTGGKDSTIRKIFSGINPQYCEVTSFKVPSELETDHDFLWRIHQHVPKRGYIGIFNRSHYEDVLVARVKKTVSEKRWLKRYDHINHFEEMLADENVVILKFFLHISKDYQRERLQMRLKDKEKLWKFNINDVIEREHWNEYQVAYEELLSRCSCKHAPWYIIPAEKHWYRDLLIANILVDKLTELKMEYPTIEFDPSKIKIK